MVAFKQSQQQQQNVFVTLRPTTLAPPKNTLLNDPLLQGAKGVPLFKTEHFNELELTK